MKGMRECQNTGRDDVNLARKALELASDPQRKKLATDSLKTVLAHTPEKRIDEANENWVLLARLLCENYHAQKDETSASKLESEIRALDPSGKYR